jgi:hypothetical protein
MSRQKRARRGGNEVLGYIVWNARFYAVVFVPIVLIWLVRDGYLSVGLAWGIGAVATLAMGWILGMAVGNLVQGPINRSGCGIGLICYWLSFLLLGLMYWQGGLDLLLLGIMIVPLVIVVIGIAVSRMNPVRRNDPWPRR